MSKITYEFYSEKDADTVAELMRRNRFWIGKYNTNLDGDTLKKYQSKKGFVFGIVGKSNDKVVTYVAAYKYGSQRICKQNQIIMSGLIIDNKYRMAIFSITQMFKMLLFKCVDLGVNDIISEVNVNNKLSLSMMKKTGFLALDDAPTIFGEYVLHNYMPSLLRFFDSKDIDNPSQSIMSVDRKKATQKPNFIAPNIISIVWNARNLNYEFLIDIETGEAIGVHCHGRYKILRVDNNTIYYHNCVNENATSKLIIASEFSHGIYSEEFICQGEAYIKIPAETKSIKLYPETEPDGFCFFARNYECSNKNEEKINKTQIYDCNSGYLYFNDKTLCELWPCMDYPYLESPITPNYDKQLKTTISKNKITKDKITAVYTTKRYLLRRIYEISANKTLINTELFFNNYNEPGNIDPIFHLAINSDNAEIIFKNSEKSYTYSLSNKQNVFAELIFEDFKNDYPSDTKFSNITFKVDGVTHILEATLPFYAIANMNYVVIRFDMNEVEHNKNNIKFPTITIKKV